MDADYRDDSITDDSVLCAKCHKPLDIGFDDVEVEGELFHEDCVERQMEDDVAALDGDTDEDLMRADVSRRIADFDRSVAQWNDRLRKQG